MHSDRLSWVGKKGMELVSTQNWPTDVCLIGKSVSLAVFGREKKKLQSRESLIWCNPFISQVWTLRPREVMWFALSHAASGRARPRSQVSWLPRHSAAQGMEQVVSLALGAMGQSFQLRAAWGSNQGNQRKHQLKMLTAEWHRDEIKTG